MFNDPAYADNETNLQAFKKISEELYTTLELGKNDEALCSFLQGIGTPIEVIDGMFRKSPQWNTMLALAPTLMYDTMLANQLPPVTKASQLKTPTQIIVGEKSPSSMHKVAKQLNEAIPNAVFNVLKDQDHMPEPKEIRKFFVFSRNHHNQQFNKPIISLLRWNLNIFSSSSYKSEKLDFKRDIAFGQYLFILYIFYSINPFSSVLIKRVYIMLIQHLLLQISGLLELLPKPYLHIYEK